MQKLAWVCLGSALGGGTRYLVGQAALALLGGGFPYGTLAVNALGAFAMGFLAPFAVRGALAPEAQLFLATGVLGGFTTYSSFNQETLALAARGAFGLAGLYLAATLLGCLALGGLGAALGRAVLGGE